MLWSKFVKFLMSILKGQVDTYPNFVSLFSFMEDNSLYFLSSNNTYFALKGPIKVKMFETFDCSGQNVSNSLCQFWKDKSIPLQILYPSSVSQKITPLYFFSSNNIYFAQKKDTKIKFSGQNLPNSAPCQFWNDLKSQFLFKFCIILHGHDT